MNRKLTSRLLCALALVLGSASAQSEFKYSIFEASYVFGEFDFGDSDVDIEGYRLTGQFSVSPGFVVGLAYSSIDGDETVISNVGRQSLNFKADGAEVFGFYHTALGIQTDFIFGARLDMIEVDVTQGSEVLADTRDENINFLFSGFRHRLNGLEFEIQWSYNLDTEDDQDKWSYSLGLLSGDPTALQLGFQFTPGDNGDVMGVSIRQSY